MLHAVAREDLDLAIIAAHRHGDGEGALGIFQPVTFVRRDVQPVRHEVELLAGHVEGRVVIDVHGGI